LKLFGLVRVYSGVVILLRGTVRVVCGLIWGVTLNSLIIEWVIYTTPGGVSIEIIFLFDYIRLIFIGVVMLISSIVLVYRSDYIEADVYFYRFIFLVVLFVTSIVFMVLSPNIVRILLG